MKKQAQKQIDLTQPLLSTEAAAERLQVSARTLEKKRLTGTGPRYVKLGSRTVRYTLADLEAFAAAGTRQSTSDDGEGVR